MEYNFLFQKKEIGMKTLIHPTYFPNIEFFSHLLKSKNLIFEINDFYQKQTLRNRTSIVIAHRLSSVINSDNNMLLLQTNMKEVL